MLSFRGAKLSNQVLKSKTCGREFVFFLEKPSFYALFIGVKEENGFSCRLCKTVQTFCMSQILLDSKYSSEYPFSTQAASAC